MLENDLGLGTSGHGGLNPTVEMDGAIEGSGSDVRELSSLRPAFDDGPATTNDSPPPTADDAKGTPTPGSSAPTSADSFVAPPADEQEVVQATGVGAVSDANGAADSVAENAADGTTVGITALASDADGSDTVSYTLSNDAGGRFAIDANSGVVTVADGSQLDYENQASHTIEVTATSTDTSISTQSFTVNLGDADEFDVSAISDSDSDANTVAENAANGTTVGITASASDADGSDSVTYTLSNDAGGRFAIDGTTGVVTVANGSLLDYESATSHSITVLATSSDSSTSSQAYTVNLTDVAEGGTAPVAVDDAAPTDLDTAVIIAVLANDSDADSDPLTVASVTQGTNGTVAINGDNTVTYTPNASYTGTDTFTYTADDGNGGTDTATVSVYVGIAIEGTSSGETIDGSNGVDDVIFGHGGDDTLRGRSGDDTMYGGDGADDLNGHGGADSLFGGAGDDVLHWDSADAIIAGGSGTDTLGLSTGTSADLTTFSGMITGIERVDLGNAGVNDLTLSAQDVLDMDETNILTVDGDAEDSVDAGTGWTDGGIVGGYHVYTQGLATLNVDIDLSVNLDIAS